MKHIYCISGFGADERAFSKLNFGNNKVHFLPWLLPITKESIEEYAQRMGKQIQHENPVLIGLSFGGMMSIEIAKCIKTELVIIISSIKSFHEIPLWIKYMVTDGQIDFATFKHASPKTNKELMDHFEENMMAARSALENTTDKILQGDFTLKSNGEVMYTSKKIVDIGVTLNHWVHHRAQLTVYMRLNDIAVPAIYGPSADEKNFTVPK